MKVVIGLLNQKTTPFARQCFVVLGASIILGQLGMMLAFTVSLLPQLRAEDSPIPLDDDSSSWVASLPGMTIVLGNMMGPIAMSKCGRKAANIISILVVIGGWMFTILSNNLVVLLIGRFLQGISAGMGLCITPIAIGEYTSPKNRGAFSVVMTFMIAASILMVHGIGAYVHWRIMGTICTSIGVINLIMVMLTPETPSYLAERGKYDESQKVFRWLRGNDEDEELFKMIEASKRNKSVEQANFGKKLCGFFVDLTRKEVYKPIIIMVHLYMFSQWSGINQMTSYTADLVKYILGDGVDTPAVMISLGIQRTISSMLSAYVIKKFKRKTMLLGSVIINVLMLLIIAAYVYCRQNKLLPYEHPAIGGLLLHLLMMIVAIGSFPVPLAIAGEIFPMKYRSVCGGLSLISMGLGIFLSVKSFPFIYNGIGLWGACCVYSVIMLYGVLVAWFLLPETKDRTLQDIEDEFKRK